MKISAEIHRYVSIKKNRRRSTKSLERRAVHDRKAADLVRGAMVHPVEVDDPLEKLFKLKQIDGQQLEAGREWQKDYEAAQGPSAVRAMQYKDPVDGGGNTIHQNPKRKQIILRQKSGREYLPE